MRVSDTNVNENAQNTFLGDRYKRRFRPMVREGCPVCPQSCLSVKLVYCGQTVEWIKMPLGMDVVLDGDPAPPHRKDHSSPSTFRPISIVAKRSPISVTAELLQKSA